MDESRLLAREDRTDLRLEQSQHAIMDRARAVDGDADFANAFRDHTGQVKTCPDMATVGTGPAIVGWNRLLPGTA